MLQRDVYNFCADYAKCPSEGYRLMIYGQNGCGKTHTARAIARWASLAAINLPLVSGDEGQRLATSEFFNWPKVVSDLKRGSWEIVDDMMPVNMLVLDDIGAEHDPSQMAVEKLYLLLERRVNMWTVVTTNYVPDAWESRFERRIASRLMRNFKHIALDEVPDYNASTLDNLQTSMRQT